MFRPAVHQSDCNFTFSTRLLSDDGEPVVDGFTTVVYIQVSAILSVVPLAAQMRDSERLSVCIDWRLG